MRQEQVIELAGKHGATSYAHRSDTQNPAYGFTKKQLVALVGEVGQATLERAATVAESMSKIRAAYSGKDLQDAIAEAIRNLAKEKPCEQPSSQQP